MNGPTLTPAERIEWDKICRRVARASTDLRRANKRGDAELVAKAERAMARARAARDAFCVPRCAGLNPPRRLRVKSEWPWSGKSGSGMHVIVTEMVLDHVEIVGPYYRHVRTISDVGGPPTNRRGAPDSMGVAWFAVEDQIARGHYTVIEDTNEES